MTFVVDASLALAWCFDDEATDAADELMQRAMTETVVVPGIWPLEMANVLLLAERRSRIGPAKVKAFVDRLEALMIKVEPSPPETAFGDVLTLARANRLTVYDAAYLELAQRLRVPLATRDRELVAAAGRVGVAILTG